MTDPEMTDPEIRTSSLVQALQHYGIELPPRQASRLEAYCKLLWDWNSKINLTRHLDYDRFVSRDVIDSMEVAKLLRPNEEVLDVGSGGGVPGIVLAILRPDVQFALSDSVGKKAKVLTQMVDELDLPVAVHACRAEEVLDQFRFDTLVARAVGPLDKMLKWFAPHWASIGRLLAVKGPKWQDEYDEAKSTGKLGQLEVQCVAKYPMPGLDSHSVILAITRRPGR